MPQIQMLLRLMQADEEPCGAARVAQPTDGFQILEIGSDFTRMQMPGLGKLAAAHLNIGSSSSTALQMPKERGHPQSTAGSMRSLAVTVELLEGPEGEFNGFCADGVKAHG
jgi:hypothetical protein